MDGRTPKLRLPEGPALRAPFPASKVSMFHQGRRSGTLPSGERVRAILSGDGGAMTQPGIMLSDQTLSGNVGVMGKAAGSLVYDARETKSERLG